MASQMELSKAEIGERHVAASAKLHELETQLIEARATELYWRRALRKAVFADLAAEFGGDVPSSLPDEDTPADAAGIAAAAGGSETVDPPIPPKAKRAARSAADPDRLAGAEGVVVVQHHRKGGG